MTDGGQAARRLSWLARDRSAEIDALLQEMGGDPGWPRTRLEGLRAGEGRDAFIDAGGIAPALWPLVRQGLPAQVAPGRDLDRLLFHDLDVDQVSAVCGVEADGSGLVLISDGLLGLVIHLSRLLAYVSYGGAHGTLGGAKLAWAFLRNNRGHATGRQRLAEALVRFHLIQQKCFGLPGKLDVRLSAAEDNYAISVGTVAMFFIMAHEAGHFALGHGTAGFNMIDGVEVPVVSDDEALELEADRYAFDTALKLVGDTADEVSRNIAVLGAGLALLAVDMVEETCFLRSPRTHPPAARRFAELLTEAGSDRRHVDGYIDVLRQPVFAAARTRHELPPDAWTRVWANRDVVLTGHNADAVDYTATLDQLVHGSLPNERFGQLGRDEPLVAAVADALVEVRTADDVGPFLAALGVPPDDIERVTDVRQAVTFRLLLEILERSPMFGRMRSKELRLLVGSVTVRRLAPFIATSGRAEASEPALDHDDRDRGHGRRPGQATHDINDERKLLHGGDGVGVFE